jgi:hypothetical protein
VEDAFVALNDGNALFRFNLSTGVAQKLFAPINPDGGSIALSAIEQSELGVAFLPAGGEFVFKVLPGELVKAAHDSRADGGIFDLQNRCLDSSGMPHAAERERSHDLIHGR